MEATNPLAPDIEVHGLELPHVELLRIEVFRGDVVWMAHLRGNAEVVAAFGTDLLPTAFGIQMPAIQVKERLRKLNPAAEVVCAESMEVAL